MGVKPWWLWEGAAVRDDEPPLWVGRVAEFHDDNVVVEFSNGVTNLDHSILADRLTPIENPAVMLAPEGATHVEIARSGWVDYLHAEGYTAEGFMWPQCPEHLRGKTWELPKGEKL